MTERQRLCRTVNLSPSTVSAKSRVHCFHDMAWEGVGVFSRFVFNYENRTCYFLFSLLHLVVGKSLCRVHQ